MSLIVPNIGELQLLKQALGYSAVESLLLKLYCNNYTPVAGSVAGNFTEASGGGYAAKTLTASSWTFAGGNPTTASYPVQTFTFTGALTTNTTVYGYYILGGTSGSVYWAELLATAFTPANNGDNIQLTLNFSLT